MGRTEIDLEAIVWAGGGVIDDVRTVRSAVRTNWMGLMIIAKSAATTRDSSPLRIALLPWVRFSRKNRASTLEWPPEPLAVSRYVQPRTVDTLELENRRLQLVDELASRASSERPRLILIGERDTEVTSRQTYI